jgi:hypothetical protein
MIALSNYAGRNAGMENHVRATMSMGRGEHAGRGRVNPMLAIEACLRASAADFPDFPDFE